MRIRHELLKESLFDIALMLFTILLIIVLVTSVNGCAHQKEIKVVKVPAPTPIEISPKTKKLFEPLPIAEPTNNTVGECLNVAKKRKNSVLMCNARLFCIWENINGRPCEP